MNGGFILLLNGCSSSGKTSIARELQRAAPELQLVHISLDAFRAMEPDGFWAPDRRADWPARLAALCHAINDAARAYTRQGQNVILDHVLSREAWSYLDADLSAERMYLVRVQCDLQVAEAREAKRADRAAGLARSQRDSVHAGRSYDLTVDTSHSSAGAVADSLRDWIQRHPDPVQLACRGAAP